MKNPSKQIDLLLSEAHEIGIQFIESEARKIMRNNLRGYEFVMAMGNASFHLKDECISASDDDSFYSSKADRPYLRKLRGFFEEYDRVLFFTGTPMRFTADGIKVTDW